MIYRRIQEKHNNRGMFHGCWLEDYRENINDEKEDLLQLLDKGHERTEWICDLDGKEVHHYYKEDFFNKHKVILQDIAENIPVFELVKIESKDIKKIYFEDKNQIIAELI